jgi:GNAT superfamily N-acetyltransferase
VRRGLSGTIGHVTELASLSTSRGPVVLRRATREDVPRIVDLLMDDPLGVSRDGADDTSGLEPYVRAFDLIDDDPAHLLVVAQSDGRVVATMQLSLIPGLARRGALRAQVEAVRVHADLRGSGLGRAMVGWAVDEARRRGCALVQLTSDKQRPEAHRFYAGLGFTASHEGFKLEL